jgi:hypothetical protein
MEKIAAPHYGDVPSAENNRVFGQAESFVAGPPTNTQAANPPRQQPWNPASAARIRPRLATSFSRITHRRSNVEASS